MLLFIYKSILRGKGIQAISKHLMLLFISLERMHRQDRDYISKHLMLLFITIHRKQPDTAEKISKHLMLLFIDEVDTINFAGYIFQNISCYCLSRQGINGML